MKRLVLYIVLGALVLAGLVGAGRPGASISATNQQTMQVAGRLYDSQQYAEAARLYQQVVDQGRANVDLYYNLGNAYAQTGDTGHAILNYTRALRLAPRDPDIRANLHQMLKQANLETEALALSPLERLVDAEQSTFTANELAVGVLAAWFGITLFWLVRRAFAAPLVRRVAGLGLLVSISLLLVGGYVQGATMYREQVAPDAVVVAPVTLAGAKVQAGAEVSVMERRGEQLRISWRGHEVAGWVSTDAIEII